MKNKWFLLALCAVALFFILPIGGRPLMAPDETRYAEIAREMIDDWLANYGKETLR